MATKKDVAKKVVAKKSAGKKVEGGIGQGKKRKADGDAEKGNYTAISL